MTTIIAQSELTKRAIDWISEQAGADAAGPELCRHIAAAATRFNLGPLEQEFLERFFADNAPDAKVGQNA